MKIENKIVKFLNENTAHKQVELTDNPNRRAISDAWPDGVFYNGQRIFDHYIKAINIVKGNIKKSFPGDMQEVFLGYSPRFETFIMGFDYWPAESVEYNGEDDDDNDGGPNHEFGSITVPLIFDGHRFSASGKAIEYDDGFYNRRNGGYAMIHAKYSDLIDIRLD